MKTLVIVCASLSLIAFSACSKKEDEGKKGTKPKTDKPKTDKGKKKPVAKPTTKTPKAPDTTKKPATTKPAAPLKASKFGPFGIARCTVDGSPMAHESFSKAIGALAATANAVFVIDHEGSLRRYLIKPGADCVLALDAAFANKGVLKPAKKIDAMATDSKGTLYAVTDRKLAVLAGGKLEAFCKADLFATDSLSVTPDDKHIIANGFSGKWSKIELAKDACKQTPWAYTPKLKFSDANMVGGRLIMVGKQDIKKKHEVHAFGLNGGASATKFATGEKTADDNMLCNSAGAFSCGKGVCVIDNNCRKLLVFGADGKFTEKAEFKKEMFGKSYVWVTSVAQGAPDVAFMGVTIKRPKAKDGDKKAKRMDDGFIFRVSGLAAK